MRIPKTASNDNENQRNDNLHPSPCPVCGKQTVEKYKPFCSKRCADVDLHRWLSGGYAIQRRRTRKNAPIFRMTTANDQSFAAVNFLETRRFDAENRFPLFGTAL